MKQAGKDIAGTTSAYMAVAIAVVATGMVACGSDDGASSASTVTVTGDVPIAYANAATPSTPTPPTVRPAPPVAI